MPTNQPTNQPSGHQLSSEYEAGISSPFTAATAAAATPAAPELIRTSHRIPFHPLLVRPSSTSTRRTTYVRTQRVRASQQQRQQQWKHRRKPGKRARIRCVRIIYHRQMLSSGAALNNAPRHSLAGPIHSHSTPIHVPDRHRIPIHRTSDAMKR